MSFKLVKRTLRQHHQSQHDDEEEASATTTTTSSRRRKKPSSSDVPFVTKEDIQRHHVETILQMDRLYLKKEMYKKDSSTTMRAKTNHQQQQEDKKKQQQQLPTNHRLAIPPTSHKKHAEQIKKAKRLAQVAKSISVAKKKQRAQRKKTLKARDMISGKTTHQFRAACVAETEKTRMNVAFQLS